MQKNSDVVSKYTDYHPNGVIKTIAHYQNEKLCGPMTLHDESGRVMQKANYKEGVLDGVLTIYLAGKKYCEKNFLSGKLDGESRFYNEAENLALSQNYKADQLHGKSSWYYDNGGLLKVAYFNFNKLHGKVISYLGNGKAFEKLHYRNGVKHGNVVQYVYQDDQLKVNKVKTKC